MIRDSQNLILHKFITNLCRAILAATRGWRIRRRPCRSISAASVRKWSHMSLSSRKERLKNQMDLKTCWASYTGTTKHSGVL